MTIQFRRKFSKCPLQEDCLFLDKENRLFVGRLQEKRVFDEPYAYYYGANFGTRVNAWSPLPGYQLPARLERKYD